MKNFLHSSDIFYGDVHNPDIYNTFFHFMYPSSLGQKYLLKLMEGGTTRTLLCRPISADKNWLLNAAAHKQTKQQENPGLPFVCFVVFSVCAQIKHCK